MRTRANRASEPPTRPAAFVKGKWREVVDEANRHGEVVVTNHNRPEVVVLSMARYEELQREAAENDPLTELRAEWDRQLAPLREPDAADQWRRLFRATPAEIAAAANAAALKRSEEK